MGESTQKPFEVGDLRVAHPQLGHCLRQCSLLSWDKKSLLLFQNTAPFLTCLPPWASPPSGHAQHLVFPSPLAALASPPWGRKREKWILEVLLRAASTIVVGDKGWG